MNQCPINWPALKLNRLEAYNNQSSETMKPAIAAMKSQPPRKPEKATKNEGGRGKRALSTAHTPRRGAPAGKKVPRARTKRESIALARGIRTRSRARNHGNVASSPGRFALRLAARVPIYTYTHAAAPRSRSPFRPIIIFASARRGQHSDGRIPASARRPFILRAPTRCAREVEACKAIRSSVFFFFFFIPSDEESLEEGDVSGYAEVSVCLVPFVMLIYEK